MPTLMLFTPFFVRLIQRIVPIFIGFLLLPIIIAAAVLQKSTLVWPVVAPTQISAHTPTYHATGWTVSSPFGWRPNPEDPSVWEFHEGIDLVGPMFCDGCPVPPMADSLVDRVGWDQPYAPDPRTAGGGVVVEMLLRHPEEAGSVRIQYAHLQPYQVWIRTQTCTQEVDCPAYQDELVGHVQLSCPGDVLRDGVQGAVRSYFYATPGTCRARVDWPEELTLTPDGPVTITFDQQILPGSASSNAAITFRAQYPPPPTPEPTAVPTLVPTLVVPTTPTPVSQFPHSVSMTP